MASDLNPGTSGSDSSQTTGQTTLPSHNVMKAFYTVQSENEAKCLSCKKSVKHSGRSSNLISHLQKKHAAQHQLYLNKIKDAKETKTKKQMDAGKITGYFPTVSTAKYSSNHPKQLSMTKSLLGAIAADGLPLNVVEKPFFRRLMGEADPKFAVPSRPTIRNQLLPGEVDKLVVKMKTELTEITQVYATVDAWSNRNNDSFFGFTIHFIDAEFVLKKRILACRKFVGRHTAENIAQMFDDICAEYNIQGKVKKVVSDNASSMKKALDVSLPLLRDVSVGSDDEEGEDEEKGDDDVLDREEDLDDVLAMCPQRVPCFAHTLQLAVQDGLKTIDSDSPLGRALKNVGKVVKSVRRSTVAAPALREAGVSLHVAVKTRWNSELKMIESAIKDVGATNRAVSLLGAEQRRRVSPLQPTDVAALQELIDLLQPFAEATDMTEGDAVVTVSAIVPSIVGIEKHLQSIADRPTRYTSGTAAALSKAVRTRLEQFKTLDNSIAAVLDPRLKTSGTGTSADEEAQQEIRRRVDVLKTNTCSDDDLETPSGDETTCETSAPKRSRLLAFLDVEYPSTSQSSRRRSGTGGSAVDKYFSSPRINIANPLDFWKDMSKNGEENDSKMLAEVAREALGLTATSAASERLFSVAGNIMRDRRARMSDKVFEGLVIIACNAAIFNA